MRRKWTNRESGTNQDILVEGKWHFWLNSPVWRCRWIECAVCSNGLFAGLTFSLAKKKALLHGKLPKGSLSLLKVRQFTRKASLIPCFPPIAPRLAQDIMLPSSADQTEFHVDYTPEVDSRSSLGAHLMGIPEGCFIRDRKSGFL